MKEFLKMMFATICGIILLSVISGIMFMISLIGMIVSDSGSVKVKDNSVFVLKMNGIVNERVDEASPMSALLGMTALESLGLDDFLSSIEKAKYEDGIKGIYLEGGIAEFDSPASAQQIRDALEDFKQSGKWIIAYADDYMQTSYYIASVADSVFLNKTGMLELKGLGGKSQYMTGLYEKLGIKYQPVRVGKYKSYVESVTRKDMSAEDREQRETYQQGIWQHMLKSIADSRKLQAQQIDQAVSDSIMAFANPEDYVKGKLVDRLMYPEGIKEVIKHKLGLDEKDDIRQLTLTDMISVKSKKKEAGDQIAVYYAYGEIIDELTSSFMSSASIVGNVVVEDLNKLAQDDNVKAVVLRVNSPGGSAVASEQIWHALKNLKAKKPLVVSMGGLAASGGYMISSPADFIFAEPTTITGSIGIFGLIPNFSGLATDKLGVTFDGTKTNRYTDFEENLVLGKDNSEELQFMQTYVSRGYDTFLTIVADGRKLSKEQVNEVAQGRVWLATDALPIKLIDKLGSLDDAVKKAAELAKIDGDHYACSYPAKSSWMDNLFPVEDKGSYLDSELHAVLGDLYVPVMEMRRDQQRNRLQARLPYSVSVK